LWQCFSIIFWYIWCLYPYKENPKGR